jgi:hypothetical protein
MECSSAMPENPYQPPSAPLTEEQATPVGLRKRFRLRLIPATLCFVFGGSSAFAFVLLVGLVVFLITRVGVSRIDFGVVMLVLIEVGLFAALLLFSGGLWLRGRWRSALLSIVLAFVAAFLLDVTIGRPNQGRGSMGDLLDRMLKPR